MDLALTLVLPALAFLACLGAQVATPAARATQRARTGADWLVDGVNLGVQGWLVPLGGAWLGAQLLGRWIPAGSWALGWWGGLAVNLVVVDGLYWVNHRLLHAWWPVHRVHHGATAMDVWVSSRNTAWATALLVYPWAHAVMLHALDAPGGYALGVALTASLDLWRHSGLSGAVPGLVSPRAHAWHHAAAAVLPGRDVNFGANLDVWDRLAGTWHDPGHPPPALGIPTGLSTARALLWPFGASS